MADNLQARAMARIIQEKKLEWLREILTETRRIAQPRRIDHGSEIIAYLEREMERTKRSAGAADLSDDPGRV